MKLKYKVEAVIWTDDAEIKPTTKQIESAICEILLDYLDAESVVHVSEVEE